jgi:pimeloyl-ACP methyl ester carboxylesterase
VRRVEAGAGEPAVVLEAGLNNGAASWQRVMPLLAPHVRVAAYDRAGLGGSAPAPGRATIDRQIDDLASVITGLAAGPCVLAGHSWGGILVQLLALRRPELAGSAHWTRLLAGLAAAAAQGRHVVVDGTGHNIPRHRPDVVAGTILAVAAQARASGG